MSTAPCVLPVVSGRYYQTLYRTRRIIDKTMIDKARSLVSAFDLALLQAYRDGFVDPLSYHLVCLLPALYRLPGTLLAYFKCRWSEIEPIKLEHLESGSPLEIYQGKTGNSKQVDTFHISQSLRLAAHSKNAPIIVVPYQSVAKKIKAARIDLGISIPESCKSETHIFRHFFASWAVYNKVPKSEISKILGHSSALSINSYIHKWPMCKTINPI